MIYIPSENFVSKYVEVTLEEEWCKIKPKEPPASLFFAQFMSGLSYLC